MKFINGKNEKVLDAGSYDSIAIANILSMGKSVTCTNGIEYIADTNKKAIVEDFGTRSYSDKTLVFYVKESK